MKTPLLLGIVALGGVGLALTLSKKSGDVVTGKSGKSWRVVLIATTGNVKTYEIFAPEGSFGPHAELSVLRYSQTGSDMGSRQIVGVGEGAPEAMVSAAASDFGIPFDPALMP
jgi:hypothetical protein